MFPFKPLFSLLFILMLTVGSNAAHAQLDVSSAEDVAFVFFKTAGSPPDFDKWAKETKEYKVAAPAFAANVANKEKQRLMRRWQDIEQRAPSLETRMDVPVVLHHEISQEGAEHFWMSIKLPENDIFYFPYSFHEYSFAVMPEGLEKVKLQPLQKAQYELMLSAFDNQLQGNAALYVLMYPVKAYMDQPYEIHGKEQWALITRVAALSLKATRTQASLWDYSAPWYLSPKEREVRGLYEEENSQAADTGPSIP